MDYKVWSKADMSKRLQNRISRISSRKSAENFLSRKSAGKKFG